MNSFLEEKSYVLTALVLTGAFVYLYLNLFILPATPIHFLTPDATNFLFNARRMQHGQVIYRDFFELTLPATEVYYLALFKIFGNRAWIPNATLILLGVGLTYTVLVISRNVISGTAAYLPALWFLVIPFRSQLDATHHWFSTFFVMAALALLVVNISALRLVGAGALLAIAFCFTQTSGLLAAVGLLLFFLWAALTGELSWANFRRTQFYTWSAFGIVAILFNAYFAIRAGMGTFLYETFVFNFRYYSSGFGNSFHAYMTDVPAFHPWYRLPALGIWGFIYLLIPLIYILFFVRYRDEKEDQTWQPWDRLVLIAIVGAMLFVSVAPSPTWLRLCMISAPAIILFVWYMSFPGRLYAIRVGALWVVIIAIALGEWHARIFGWREQVNLPIGRMVVFNQVQYQEIKFLLDHTKPGDYFFGNNELNYLLDLRDPSPIPFVTPTNYTRPGQVLETIQGLEKHPAKYIYWSSTFDMPPASGGRSDHLAPLRAYVAEHYQVKKTIEGDDFARTFWEKFVVPTPIPIPGPIPLAAPSEAGETPGETVPPGTAPAAATPEGGTARPATPAGTTPPATNVPHAGSRGASTTRTSNADGD